MLSRHAQSPPAADLRLPDHPREWAAFYRAHLLEFVMPYWRRPGVLDREHDGLLNCRDDAGNLISADKYMWSQTRGLWTFSALYRRVERRPEWREIADSLFAFCRRHGRAGSGAWHYRVTREGAPLDGALSIATDSFAIAGMTEYARATGNAEAVDIARSTFQQMNRRIRHGQPPPFAPYVVPPGMKVQGIAMISSLAFYELGELLGEAEILAASAHFTRQILEEFARPEHRAVVEHVRNDGSFADTPEGRTMVPGHGIEAMWFQLEIFRRKGDGAPPALLLEAMRWCLERGWDQEYGGLMLGLDIFGKDPPYWKHSTTKPWWPATETLVATLMACEVDRSPRWLEEHRRVADWALAHYPVPEHGEWRQRLDRQGRPYANIIGLPVKDPFHLPRALIYTLEILGRLAKAGDARFA